MCMAQILGLESLEGMWSGRDLIPSFWNCPEITLQLKQPYISGGAQENFSESKFWQQLFPMQSNIFNMLYSYHK